MVIMIMEMKEVKINSKNNHYMLQVDLSREMFRILILYIAVDNADD